MDIRIVSKFGIRILLTFFCTTVNAENLVVLAERGGTPVREIIGEIVGVDKDEIRRIKEERREAILNGEQTKSSILRKLQANFPINSALSERRIVSRDFSKQNQYVSQPIALLGSGGLSKQWLNKHKSTLKEINAFVAVVDVESQEEVTRMSNIYGREIVALHLDQFLDEFQVEGLPALITKDGIYQ